MLPTEEKLAVPFANGSGELRVESGTLSLYDSHGVLFFDFKINPYIQYSEQPPQTPEVIELLYRTSSRVLLASRDAWVEKQICIEFFDDHLDYWVEVSLLHNTIAPIEAVYYGQDGPGIGNGSDHFFDEFYIICPDRYGSCIPKSDKAAFKLGVSSFRFGPENNFPHEGGRTIISPYVTALRAGNSWLGIGTMEIPSSEYGLSMAFSAGRTSLDFTYGGNLSPECGYRFPKISFFTGPDKLAVCKKYIDRLYSDKLANPQHTWHKDWAGPIYCFFSDQMYEYQTDRSTVELQGEMAMTENYCNDVFLGTCLDFLDNASIPYKTIIIDYGWFIMNGEWRPHAGRFSDFRETIRKIQSTGRKVLVWYSPYFVARESANYQQHPQIGVNKKDGTPFSVVRFGTEVNFQPDFTNPQTRALVEKDFRYILDSSGLDADGIKIDCTHQPPAIGNRFFDTSWGTGEMYHYTASRFMYETAKKIKPDCCINATAGNPFFNNTFDLHRIHDALEYNTDAYEERAWAAWFCRSGISDLDDWPSYDLYTVRSNVRKIAYGVPSLYAARKRGGERKPKASWGYAVSVRDDELRLLSSLYSIYLKSPVNLDQNITIDPARKIFNRAFTAGPLSGFYASTTINGNQGVVTYTQDCAYVVSITNAAISVPVPANATNITVSAMARDKSPDVPIPFEKLEQDILFQVQRCDSAIAWYAVRYCLQEDFR